MASVNNNNTSSRTQPTQCYSLGSVWCSESLAGIYCVGLGFLTLSPCSSSALLSVPLNMGRTIDLERLGMAFDFGQILILTFYWRFFFLHFFLRVHFQWRCTK